MEEGFAGDGLIRRLVSWDRERMLPIFDAADAYATLDVASGQSEARSASTAKRRGHFTPGGAP
jgi:hypothetical protein